MTNSTDKAEALLRDVPRIWAYSYDVNEAANGAEPEEWKTYQTWDTTDPYPILGKEYVAVSDVLAALSRALDGVNERAGMLARSDDPKVMLYHGEYVEALCALLAQNAFLLAEINALRAEREKEAKAHEKEIYVWSENYAALERKLSDAEAVAEKLRGAIRNLKREWYLRDLQSNDFDAALTTEANKA